MLQSLYWLNQRLLYSGTYRALGNGCPEHVNSQKIPFFLCSGKSCGCYVGRKITQKSRVGKNGQRGPGKLGKPLKESLLPVWQWSAPGAPCVLKIPCCCSTKMLCPIIPCCLLDQLLFMNIQHKTYLSWKNLPSPSHIVVLIIIFFLVSCKLISWFLLHSKYNPFWLLFIKLWVHEGQGSQLIHSVTSVPLRVWWMLNAHLISGVSKWT